MKATLQGTIDAIFETETFGNFDKRVMWLKEDKPQYPNTWEVEFQQNDIHIPDNYKAGDKVEVNVVIKGRKNSKNGKERVFNCVQAVSINKIP